MNGLVFDQGDRGRHDGANDVFQVARFEAQFHLARFDLGEVQDTINQAEEVLPAFVDGLQVGLLHFGERAINALEDDAREADDGVERGAQLVGHVGQEFGFEAVHFFQALGGFLGLFVKACIFQSHANVYHSHAQEGAQFFINAALGTAPAQDKDTAGLITGNHGYDEDFPDFQLVHEAD